MDKNPDFSNEKLLKDYLNGCRGSDEECIEITFIGTVGSGYNVSYTYLKNGFECSYHNYYISILDLLSFIHFQINQ